VGITIGLCTLFFAPLKLYTDVAAVLCIAMLLSAMGALLLIPQFYSMGRIGKETRLEDVQNRLRAVEDRRPKPREVKDGEEL
jgi:uncharacterized membrane protein YdfJ with MMPL/SSD domain